MGLSESSLFTSDYDGYDGYSGDLARVLCVDLSDMGVSSSSSAPGATTPKGRKVINSKIDTSAKTGVLNLADQDLKPNSSVWSKLLADGVNMKLKTLDISGNPIKALPVEVYSMVNLKTLTSSRCSLQRTADMTSLVRLTHLTLDNNDLEELVVAPLPPTLTKLNISCNHLASLPQSISLLINLEELNLTHNRLVTIEGIETLVQLVTLILDDNELMELTCDFSPLTKLKRVSLKNNRLMPKSSTNPEVQSLPKELFTHTALDHIDLNQNAGLTKEEILKMDGVDEFIARRKKLKDKTFQGGAMTDFSLFGLD